MQHRVVSFGAVTPKPEETEAPLTGPLLFGPLDMHFPLRPYRDFFLDLRTTDWQRVNP